MKLLLLIDIQTGFPASRDVLSHVSNMDFSQYDKVIATKFINNQDTLFYKNGWRDMTAGSDVDLFPIVAEKADYVIEKDTYSLPLHKLYDIVSKDDIELIDIIGVDTDACVLATMFALWDAGIKFKLLKASTSGSNEIGCAAKLIMERNFFFTDD